MPGKRVVIYVKRTEQGETFAAFTSVKGLLSYDDVAPYDTIMNHLSRRKEPFVKGDVTIHRLDINPTVVDVTSDD